jgi:hypothetical protein
VTAVLEAPATAAEGQRPAARGRGRTVVAALLLLIGVLWSFALWVPATVDLSAGSTSFRGAAQVVTVPAYGARGTHVIDYRHGAQVEVVVPLRNDGPLPVTVRSVTADAGVLPLLALSTGDALPVVVAPGEQREVVLRGVLGNCAHYHERQVQNLDGVQVAVEVLGRDATREVALDRPLLVHSPMIVGCPDRTLTRNDDARADADPQRAL